MKLFLVHTGYYDNDISNGFYESHTNYFVVAEDIKEAKKKIKGIEEFKHKKMHIDGILEIQNIGDYSIKLKHSPKKQEQANNQYSYDDIKKYKPACKFSPFKIHFFQFKIKVSFRNFLKLFFDL